MISSVCGYLLAPAVLKTSKKKCAVRLGPTTVFGILFIVYSVGFRRKRKIAPHYFFAVKKNCLYWRDVCKRKTVSHLPVLPSIQPSCKTRPLFLRVSDNWRRHLVNLSGNFFSLFSLLSKSLFKTFGEAADHCRRTPEVDFQCVMIVQQRCKTVFCCGSNFISSSLKQC